MSMPIKGYWDQEYWFFFAFNLLDVFPSVEQLYLTEPFTCARVSFVSLPRSSKTISLQPVRCLEWQSLLLFRNIGQIVREN